MPEVAMEFTTFGNGVSLVEVGNWSPSALVFNIAADTAFKSAQTPKFIETRPLLRMRNLCLMKELATFGLGNSWYATPDGIRPRVLYEVADDSGQPGLPGQQPPTADPEKRKLIQQQLVLLLHAHKCQRREQVIGESKPCTLPHCRTMKNVLNHMTTCSAGKSCPVAHCASSTQIIAHWKNCTRPDCPVCLPLKTAPDRNNNAAAQQLGPAGESSTAFLPSQADLQQAYAALGLSPSQGQQTQRVSLTTGPQGAGALIQGVQQQQTTGLLANQLDVTKGSLTSQSQMQQLQQRRANLALALDITDIPGSSTGSAASDTPNQMTAMPNKPVKEWHQSVTQDLRNHLVHKLVQAIFPTPDPAAFRDRRMNKLVQYARIVESDMYETANSREEFYHLLAENIYKIRKELEEKTIRRLREQQQQVSQGQPAVPSQTSSMPSVTSLIRPPTPNGSSGDQSKRPVASGSRIPSTTPLDVVIGQEKGFQKTSDVCCNVCQLRRTLREATEVENEVPLDSAVGESKIEKLRLGEQSQDSDYLCSVGSEELGKMYHCTICKEYDMCADCYKSKGHSHPMEEFHCGS